MRKARFIFSRDLLLRSTGILVSVHTVKSLANRRSALCTAHVFPLLPQSATLIARDFVFPLKIQEVFRTRTSLHDLLQDVAKQLLTNILQFVMARRTYLVARYGKQIQETFLAAVEF